MSYIQNNLSSQEKLIYFARPHWVIFSSTFFGFLFAILVYYFAKKYSVLHLTLPFLNQLPLYKLITTFLILLSLWWGLMALINYYSSEYAITSQRILVKTGWIRRDILEIFLDRVESIQVYQSVMGRILSYGNVTIIGTGGTKDTFIFIPNPIKFRYTVQNQTKHGK